METITESPIEFQLDTPQDRPLVAQSSANHAVAAPSSGALAATSPAGMMMEMRARGMSAEDIRQMMAIHAEFEANEARKAYNEAFAAFKADAVRIMKNRTVTDGPLKGKSYAELHSVVDAVTPALSRHGLGASWRITKDEKDWIEVTCTLKHALGHSESVSMGGPPDTGGAKNAIQARASTVSYLERYTLKAICGVAEGGEDDDATSKPTNAELWCGKAAAATDESELRAVSKEGAKAFQNPRDTVGYKLFVAAVQARGAALKAGGGDA